MKITIFHKGFNYSQDGPGNRLVYHLQGCNLHCPWCSNPEGIPKDPPIMQFEKNIPPFVCPHGAVSAEGLERALCNQCKNRECVNIHPNRYVGSRGIEYDIKDVITEVINCRSLFFEGGGVTLTGGEVCTQADAACALLEGIHVAGIHTAIETNATLTELPVLLKHTDLLIADFKHYNSEKMRSITGAGNINVIKNINTALGLGIKTLIRIPLINGFNSDVQDIAGFVDTLTAFTNTGADFTVELLLYHEYGREKWSQCGMEYSINNGWVTAERVNQFRRELDHAGIKTVKT